MTETCSACGKPLVCGATDPTPCWCARWPALLTPVPGAGCLCPECLTGNIRAAIAAWLAEHPVPEPVPARFHTPKPIEGIDYYRENGNWVFTEWHHRKRGACCGNGCRHCAWRSGAG